MPSIANVRVDKVLTNMAVNYAPQNFVADIVAPVVRVAELGGTFFKFQKERFIRKDDRVAAGGQTNELTWDMTSDTYACKKYGLKTFLSDDIRDNADKPIQPQSNSILNVMETLKLNNEKRIQTVAQDTGTISNTAVTTTWDDAAATPEEDVVAAKEVIRGKIGRYPNYILLSPTNRNNLVATLKAKARLSYGEASTVVDLPPLLWGMKPIVPEPIENTANPGQTAVNASVWNNYVVLFYSTSRPDLQTLSFMYSLRQRDFVVRRWREEDREGEMFEVKYYQDQKIVCVDGAHILTGTAS